MNYNSRAAGTTTTKSTWNSGLSGSIPLDRTHLFTHPLVSNREIGGDFALMSSYSGAHTDVQVDDMLGYLTSRFGDPTGLLP